MKPDPLVRARWHYTCYACGGKKSHRLDKKRERRASKRLVAAAAARKETP